MYLGCGIAGETEVGEGREEMAGKVIDIYKIRKFFQGRDTT